MTVTEQGGVIGACDQAGRVGRGASRLLALVDDVVGRR
jgi:hypothetical protein